MLQNLEAEMVPPSSLPSILPNPQGTSLMLQILRDGPSLLPPSPPSYFILKAHLSYSKFSEMVPHSSLPSILPNPPGTSLMLQILRDGPSLLPPFLPSYQILKAHLSCSRFSEMAPPSSLPPFLPSYLILKVHLSCFRFSEMVPPSSLPPFLPSYQILKAHLSCSRFSEMVPPSSLPSTLLNPQGSSLMLQVLRDGPSLLPPSPPSYLILKAHLSCSRFSGRVQL